MMGRTLLTLLTLLCGLGLSLALVAAADDKAEREARRAELLKQMKALAEASDVRLAADDRPATLVTSPVFRYDDQPRRFIDATMWIWTEGARPVACQNFWLTPEALEGFVPTNSRRIAQGRIRAAMRSAS